MTYTKYESDKKSSDPAGVGPYDARFDHIESKLESGLHIPSVSMAFLKSDMTDNTDATGYIDFTTTIPALSLILAWKAVTTVGFTGDTTAVIQVGIAGDLDRFSADTTKSVLAAGTVGSAPLAADVLDGTMTSVITPRVTVTGGADFTNIAGTAATTVTIYYIPLNA